MDKLMIEDFMQGVADRIFYKLRIFVRRGRWPRDYYIDSERGIDAPESGGFKTPFATLGYAGKMCRKYDMIYVKYRKT